MRSERTEERVPLALDSLDIDHIMPQAWGTHWPLGDGTFASDHDIGQARILQYAPENLDGRSVTILGRESAVPKMGNLTLVHYGVNRSLQNHAFEKKRQALFVHSNLQLNRELMQLDHWNEAAIGDRCSKLFEVARSIWRGPAARY